MKSPVLATALLASSILCGCTHVSSAFLRDDPLDTARPQHDLRPGVEHAEASPRAEPRFAPTNGRDALRRK